MQRSCMKHFFFKSIHMCYGGDSLRLSRWERARHMARGISLRTPPSGMSCRSPGPRIWLCRGCWTDRTGSRLPAPPAPRTAPEHLTAEQNRIQMGGALSLCQRGNRWRGAHTYYNMQNQQKLSLEEESGRNTGDWNLQYQGSNSTLLAASERRQKVTNCNSARVWTTVLFIYGGNNRWYDGRHTLSWINTRRRTCTETRTHCS